MDNRYTRLTALTLGFGVLIYITLWIVTAVFAVPNVPFWLLAAISLLSSGYIVSKYVAFRIG